MKKIVDRIYKEEVQVFYNLSVDQIPSYVLLILSSDEYVKFLSRFLVLTRDDEEKGLSDQILDTIKMRYVGGVGKEVGGIEDKNKLVIRCKVIAYVSVAMQASVREFIEFVESYEKPKQQASNDKNSKV